MLHNFPLFLPLPAPWESRFPPPLLLPPVHLPPPFLPVSRPPVPPPHNFVFNQTLYTPSRERWAVMTPSNPKTLLKELFTNKGNILSCKSVKPCKNRKNSRAFYVRTRDKSGSNSSPFQHNVQIPPSADTMHSQMPRVCPGGGGRC